MASLERLMEAEVEMRELLERAELPEPDRVEYGHECVRLFWEEEELVVVIDMD